MQHQLCSGSDRGCVCCPSLTRHRGGFENDSSKQQQKEDNNVPGTQEGLTVCYYTGNSELIHVYCRNDTDTCLSDSGSAFGEMFHQQDVQDVQMNPCLQTYDDREHNNPQTSRRMNEEQEQNVDTLYPYRAIHSRWRSNQWTSLPSTPCCSARNALIVGVEVDVLEEVVYEDTAVVQTQIMFDGCLEDHIVDSTSCHCDRLFFI